MAMKEPKLKLLPPYIGTKVNLRAEMTRCTIDKVQQHIGIKRKMVGRPGFEPRTNWLKANCSTN